MSPNFSSAAVVIGALGLRVNKKSIYASAACIKSNMEFYEMIYMQTFTI